MITLIVGTNRPGSNSRKVAAHVEEIYAELKVPLRVLDLAHLPPEIFSPTSYEEKPRAFQPFAEAVLNSAGLHVVSPEYNGGIPGVLKYFIDMLKFPESFINRPVCFVGLAAHLRLPQCVHLSESRVPALCQRPARHPRPVERGRTAGSIEDASEWFY